MVYILLSTIAIRARYSLRSVILQSNTCSLDEKNTQTKVTHFNILLKKNVSHCMT